MKRAGKKNKKREPWREKYEAYWLRLYDAADRKAEAYRVRLRADWERQSKVRN